MFVKKDSFELKCPVPECQTPFFEAPPQAVCPSCRSLLSICSNPNCGQLNLHSTSFCRQCGKQIDVAAPWPQEGANQMRSGSLLEGITSRSALNPTRDWKPSLEFEETQPVDGMLPAPVATKDLVIYYNPHIGAFEARSIRPNTENFGEVVWRSSLHRDELLPYASSPVVHESLLYLLTNRPNYVHRIALSTGHRQVCRVKLDGSVMYEIPGDVLPYTPPLAFDLPKKTTSKTEINKALAVLTTEGIYIFDLFSLSQSHQPILSGRSCAMDFKNFMWSKPAALGSFIVATSQSSPDVLCVDMANYPQAIYPEIIHLKELPTSFDWNSPCIWIKDNTACWYTTDEHNRKSKLIFFRPPGFIYPMEIPFAGNQYRYQENCLGPVYDGKAVYVPYYNEKENSVGLTSCEGFRLAMRIDLPSPGISPLCAAVSEHLLIYPGRSRLYKLNIRALEPALENCGGYSNTGMETTCLSRPIIAGSYVFVQCSDLISCFEIN